MLRQNKSRLDLDLRYVVGVPPERATQRSLSSRHAAAAGRERRENAQSRGFSRRLARGTFDSRFPADGARTLAADDSLGGQPTTTEQLEPLMSIDEVAQCCASQSAASTA